LRYAVIESPIGPLMIAGDDEGLHFISFSTGSRTIRPGRDWEKSGCGVIHETIRQLQAYFAKKLTKFDLPLKPEGTPFQKEVWQELQRIPYGHVISYGVLANRIGRPRASRAVGAANGSNPLPIVIPYHRVIGCDGKMTGYGGGVRTKETLLQLEGFRSISNCESYLMQ
jgi:methylated-DNA-[protein]-cysteine S-methyltransferase